MYSCMPSLYICMVNCIISMLIVKILQGLAWLHMLPHYCYILPVQQVYPDLSDLDPKNTS